MSVRELLEAGERLGYEGDELRQFVQEQQALARREREEAREAEREARNAKREAEERARVVEERMSESRRQELELQLRIEQARQDGVGTEQAQDRGVPRTQVRAPLPKLPKFDESKDGMDAFIERFERFATCQEWPREGWAVSISSLLTGKGLRTYATLSIDESSDYDTLKTALLKSYDLNEEGYRRKFRETKPTITETASQFVSKLQHNFDRWLEMSKVDRSYEGMRDLMIKEQFMSVCHEDLAMFLKERGPEMETVEKMARIAEQYIDAHGCAIGGGARKRDRGHQVKSQGPSLSQRPKLEGLSSSSLKGSKDSERKPVVCFLCNKVGHYARECTGGRQPHQRAAGVYVRRYQRGRQWGRTDEDKDSEKGAACQIVKTRQRVIEKNVVGGRLKLASGETVPIVLGACDKQSHQSKVRGLPVCRGQVGNKQVQVLRDTGCSSAAIRSDLVHCQSN